MSLSIRLKEHTLASHQQLEKIVIKALKAIESPAGYLKLLKEFYGFIGPLEKVIDQSIDQDSVPDYAERRKAGLLLNDILALEGACGSFAAAPELPEIGDAYQALGALYVLEGSTLGGKIIARMLRGKLNLDESQDGLSYFTSYGEDAEIMWGRFKEALNRQTDDESLQRRIIEAADDTFRKFKSWIETHEL